MNKTEVLKLLNQHTNKIFNEKSLNNIDKATTNLQFADLTTAVFYNLSGESSEVSLRKRLSHSDPGILILNKMPGFSLSTPFVVLENEQLALLKKDIVEKFYPIPKNLSIYGITGTNGKSTCVCLCEQILTQLGKRAASLGTIGMSLNGVVKNIDTTGTTPSSVDLRRVIYSIRDEVDFLFIEVSSHAIDQKRLEFIKLKNAGWASFSQDHLDYHKSMDEYFIAKANIIKLIDKKGALVFPLSQKQLMNRVQEYANNNGIETNLVTADKIKNPIGLPDFLKPSYNQDNLSLCLKLLESELSLGSINLAELKAPKGRFNVIKVKDIFIIIDYAHTPDAIENLLLASREAFPSSRLITLFGCGGDRDKTKRPLMGQAAEKNSDLIVLTSDNPRSEDPNDILNDIEVGLIKPPFFKEASREKAIRETVKLLKTNDVLIIAGKGHEEYQEIKGETIDYSDFKIINSIKEKYI